MKIFKPVYFSEKYPSSKCMTIITLLFQTEKHLLQKKKNFNLRNKLLFFTSLSQRKRSRPILEEIPDE